MSSVADNPDIPDRPPEPGRLEITAPNRTILVIVIITIILGIIFGKYNQAARAVRQEYFMSNEIILVGTEDDIAALITELQEVNPNIVLTRDQDRSFSLDTLPAPAEEVLGPQTVASASLQIGSNTPACNQLSRDLEINLYELTGSVDDVEAVLAAIDKTASGDNVYSEANWVIGAPWSPTGSPWSPTGSPWSPTGSATNQGNPTPATAGDFMTQWAFQTIGMADAQAQNNGDDLAPVRVGVFDTSPYEADTVQTETLRPSSNDLNIEVQHPPFINTPVPPRPGSREDIQVSNHGFFVSGFIRTFTPTSEIKLIRVLTKNNRGDLATLNYQLLTFMGKANENDVRINTVVNMSLGVPPLEPFRPFAPLLDWEFPLPFELERQLNSLQTVAQIGECLDVVMVAAAGNDSYESLKVSNYPANWGTVLGVTASNQQNEQSCYANDGDIAAPGGDGGPSDPTADDPIACEPKLHLCKDSNCPYSVIGFVHPDTIPEGEPTAAYHHWVGTSFAAPMVSGLAALLRQLNSSLTAAEIREAIRCGTVKPTTPEQVPVINVRQTLDCAGIE